jgi:hypothetical protein
MWSLRHGPAVVFPKSKAAVGVTRPVRAIPLGKTSEPVVSISSYPHNLHHLTYTSTFGGFSFERFGTDGPWVLFDDQANTFIFSAASHYMNAVLSFGPNHELVSALSADNEEIPAKLGFHPPALIKT